MTTNPLPSDDVALETITQLMLLFRFFESGRDRCVSHGTKLQFHPELLRNLGSSREDKFINASPCSPSLAVVGINKYTVTSNLQRKKQDNMRACTNALRLQSQKSSVK